MLILCHRRALLNTIIERAAMADQHLPGVGVLAIAMATLFRRRQHLRISVLLTKVAAPSSIGVPFRGTATASRQLIAYPTRSSFVVRRRRQR